jgi:hypothetical protein
MVSINREVIQNPNLHQSHITYSWEQNAIQKVVEEGEEEGDGEGEVKSKYMVIIIMFTMEKE